MTRAVLGLDIGGANLKAVHVRDADVVSISHPFPLWRVPDRLTDARADLLRQLPSADAFAVTMLMSGSWPVRA